MITTITLEQAIIDTPSIDCSMPSVEVSNRYKLISTKSILEKCIQDGWKIFETYQVGKLVTTQHYVLMVHDVVLNSNSISKNKLPFLCVSNSHNGKQKLKYTLGYFLTESNSKIFTEDHYMENSSISHKEQTEEEIYNKLNSTKIYVKSFLDTIEGFKQRILSEQEIKTFELYINKLTNKKIKLDRKPETSVWDITESFHKQLNFCLNRTIKISQIFWKSVCSSMIFTENDLYDYLINNE